MSSTKLIRALEVFSKDLRNELVSSLKEHLEKENKLDESMTEVLDKFMELSVGVTKGKKGKSKAKSSSEDKPAKEKSGYAKYMSAFLKKNYVKSGNNGTQNMKDCQATWKLLKEKYPQLIKDGNKLFAKWEEEEKGEVEDDDSAKEAPSDKESKTNDSDADDDTDEEEPESPKPTKSSAKKSKE